jgi:Tol biopolymer transport system component
MATKEFLSATMALARSRALLVLACVALAVLVACGVAAVAALEPAKAAFPGKNGKIAFLSDRDHYQGNDIFVMEPDGSGRTNLTAEMGIRGAANAAWSPDGQKIAFAAATFMVDHLASDIYTMNADGSGKTNLTNDAAVNWGRLSWFPSGNRIAYSSASDLDPAQSDLYMLSLGPDGGVVDKVKLTNTANYSEEDPAVSPDGTRIAFARYDPDSFRYDVYVMKAEPQSPTNRPKRLTAGPGGGNLPDWSPDGTKIAFVRYLLPAEGYPDYQPNAEIFVMNANGSGKTNLTRNAASDAEPAFSPDGKYIAFSSDRADAQGQSDIWKMGADGSNPTRLTVPTTEFFNAAPDWQPLP